MEEQDAVIVPEGVVELDVPCGSSVDGGRLAGLLSEFGFPALVVGNDFHAPGRVVASLFCDGVLRPLRATTVGGILRWEVCELTALAQALSERFGTGGFLDGVPFGVDESGTDLVALAGVEPGGTKVGRLAWTTTERRDMLPLAARVANEPLGVADVDGRRLVTPSLPRSDARRSPAWMVANELLMWRDGDARGIASFANDRVLVHCWDLEVRIVDPTGGWERDFDGSTVPDYLFHLNPIETDAQEWAKRFGLDAGQSEALRVLLRQRASTAETLFQAASVLGVTARLAGVAEGDLDPQTLPGYGLVHPASAWQTIRAGLVDDFNAKDGGPLFAWYRFSARKPLWRVIITALAVLFFAAMIVVKISTHAIGSLWIPVLGLTLWCIDIAIPRPRQHDKEETP